ncbi:MAG: peptidylprolyl isomerase [Syntrophothermus sp.]
MSKIHRYILSALLLLTIFPASHAQRSDSVVDGVIGIVGANIVLKSELENQYLQYRMGGNISGTAENVKCQIYESLLFQKLLLNQAQLDSATVTENQVESEMDRRMRYFIGQMGSPEKLEEFYGKSMVEIKNEMRDIIKEQMLIEMTQEKITKDVLITPSEVKAYFKSMPSDSIPEIPSELEVGIISKRPAIGEAEKAEVIRQLKQFKERVAKGDAFSTLAVLYSEDPGSAKKGGELGMFKRGEMRAEFEAAAFKLKPGEVSDIVETEDGYHIIQAIERRGEYINVRHILLQPKVSPASMQRARNFLDSVSNLINLKKMTFEEAVLKFSDDPSRNNGGLLINTLSGNSRFENSQLDPKVFFAIDKLKVGDISAPVLYKTERNKDEFRIYYLKSRTLPHKANLEQDYARIQANALKNKQNKVLNDWVEEKIKKTFINLSPRYTGCTFQRNWLKK